MKRKVILMGGKTYVISLPSAWVKKYGIQKSVELEVEDYGNQVIISTFKPIKSEIRQINITHLSPIINLVILKLYQEGYDEIKIISDDFPLLKGLDKVVNELIGFEIVQMEKNFCILKDISGSSYAEFENIFRRLFLLIQSIGKNGLDSAIKGNRLLLTELIKKDFEVNKLAFYALRLINKYGHTKIKSVGCYASIIDRLEKIADIYKQLIRFIIDAQLKPSKTTISIWLQINVLFDKCYELTYNLKPNQAIEMAILYDSTKSKIEKALTTKVVDELHMALYFRLLAETIIGIQFSQLANIDYL